MKERDNRAQFDIPFGLKNDNDQGTIKLHEAVIASVVKTAACSIDGVMRLAGGSITDSLAGFFGTRRKSEGSVKIAMSDNSVVVNVNVIAEYGKSLPDLSCKIQKTIIDEVKKITGMTVAQVNVNIQGVEDRVEEKAEDSQDS